MSSSPRQERRPDGANLYVSNLSYQTEENDLEAKFQQFGVIKSIKIINFKVIIRNLNAIK